MRRREFLGALGGAAVWPVMARGQQRERMRRVVFLHGLAEHDQEAQARVAAFREGLETLGWIENRNIKIEHLFSGGDGSAGIAITSTTRAGTRVMVGSSALSSAGPACGATPSM